MRYKITEPEHLGEDVQVRVQRSDGRQISIVTIKDEGETIALAKRRIALDKKHPQGKYPSQNWNKYIGAGQVTEKKGKKSDFETFAAS